MLTNETLHAVHRTTHSMALKADNAGAAICKFAESVGTESIEACADGSPEAHVDLLRNMQEQLPSLDVALTTWLRSLQVREEALDEISAKFRLLAQRLDSDAYTMERAIVSGDVEDQGLSEAEALIRSIFGPDVEIVTVKDNQGNTIAAGVVDSTESAESYVYSNISVAELDKFSL